MAIERTDSQCAYDTDGVSSVFPTGWPIVDTDSVTVVEEDLATGVTRRLVLGSDYTVTPATGGGMVAAIAVPPAGLRWHLIRRTRSVQPVRLPAEGRLPSARVEQTLDRSALGVQEVQRDLTRTLAAPETEMAIGALPPQAARADRLLVFDADGQPQASAFRAPDLAAILDAIQPSLTIAGDAEWTADGTAVDFALPEIWAGINSPLSLDMAEDGLGVPPALYSIPTPGIVRFVRPPAKGTKVLARNLLAGAGGAVAAAQAAAAETEADRLAVAADRVVVAADRVAVAVDKAATQAGAAQVVADKIVVAADKASTATALAQAQALVGTAGTGTATGLVYAGQVRNLVTAGDVVAVHVYDTACDSDGGAWIQKCRGTSWYNEALNTAGRGATRRFPRVALIVARAASLTIYDAHDLDGASGPRMWMVFNVNGGSWAAANVVAEACNAVLARNGRIWLTSAVGTYGMVEIDFPRDRAYRRSGSGGYGGTYRGTVAGRNASGGYMQDLTAAQALAATACNHVYASILPGAPLDSAGLAVPTVAVATASGVSVIHPWGAVYDITRTGGYYRVLLTPDGRLLTSRTDGSLVEYGRVPYADAANTAWRAGVYTNGQIVPNGVSCVLAPGAAGTHGGSGVTLLAEDVAAPTNGMVAYVASSYATGWQSGDIRGAWLCDTTTGSVTGGSLPDRSYKANGLIVNGTLARTALPCGLAAVAGFTAANWLEQPYNADLDFGVSDFAWMGWVTAASPAGLYIMDRRDVGGVGVRIQVITNASGWVSTVVSGGSAATGTTSVMDGQWHFIVALRRAGVLEVWIDGRMQGQAANALSTTNTSAVCRHGLGTDGVSAWSGAMALARISAYAPTPAQIRKIYADERALIVGGMPATLGGTSNNVAALSQDAATGLLHVGTADGISQFDGLARTSYLDASNSGPALASDTILSVSAVRGHIAVATNANAGWVADTLIARDLMGRSCSSRATVAECTTNSNAPAILLALHLDEGEGLDLACEVTAHNPGGTQVARWTLVVLARRVVGGSAVLLGSALDNGIETDAGTDVSAALSGNVLIVQVTGLAGVPLRWRARPKIGYDGGDHYVG